MSLSRKLNRSPVLSLFGVTVAVGTCLGANYYLLGRGSGAPNQTFDQQKFTKCTIVKKIPVSSTASIYTVCPPKATASTYSKYWATGLWSLEFKQPALQIARSYTPLPPRQGEDNGELRFVIRRLHGGEMSNYLSRLGVNDVVEIRGPGVEYAMTEQDRAGGTDIVFLAGGTGIASALQAVHCFMGHASDGDRINILWANRRREDCQGAPRSPKLTGLMGSLFGSGQDDKSVGMEEKPNAIVEEIQDLQRKYPGRVEMQYFVDEEGSFITPKAIKEAIGKVAGDRRKVLMASGPDGFMEHFVGKKGDWVGTQQLQGRLGGVVKSLGLNGWEVVKL